MKKTIHRKLIRDKIPHILAGRKLKVHTRELDIVEYQDALENKLLEEIREYLASHNTEELVDILEVVYALAELQGISRSSLEELRKEKQKKKGGFSRKLFLIHTQEA